MMKLNSILTATAVAIALVGVNSTAAADDLAQFDASHPARAEVNGRLDNQRARTDAKVANGTMSQAKANKVHAEDHAIRHEERAMAAKNGGHLTAQDAKTINKQENKVSDQIAH
jgi:hypothetical protein